MINDKGELGSEAGGGHSDFDGNANANENENTAPPAADDDVW